MDKAQDALSALLSDPAALASAMEMAKGLLGGMNPPAANVKEETETRPSQQKEVPREAPILPTAREDDKTRLLLALKPYLSPKRSEKVGTVLALMKGLEVLGTTSLFDWGK